MMSTYPMFKSSGVDWLGDIPSHWNVTALKRVLSEPLKYGAIETGDCDDRSFPRYLRITDFDNDGKLRDDTFASLPDEVARYYLVSEGDVLFARSGATVGKTFLFRDHKGPACFAGYLIKASTNRRILKPEFLYYFTKSPAYEAWKDFIFTQATIQNIGADKYAYLPVCLPPRPEQERIAAYLDASCAAIDAAVAAKRGQLETLDGLRGTVIQETVTKGLDPSVEMRDSGIDWLPEIPTHWNKAKLKRHVQMIRGQFTHRPRSDPAFYDGPYPFIQTGSISAADKFITEFTQTLNEDGFRISKLFPADTIVMTITGAKIAEVAVTTFEACFPDSIVGFVPDHRLNRDYLYYLLVAMKPVLLREMVVTTQPNINYVQIGGSYIPLPPVREQESIAKHIEQRILRIREIQKSLNEQIKTLTAYRRSLIHECVTGQRRVTDADVRKLHQY